MSGYCAKATMVLIFLYLYPPSVGKSKAVRRRAAEVLVTTFHIPRSVIQSIRDCHQTHPEAFRLLMR